MTVRHHSVALTCYEHVVRSTNRDKWGVQDSDRRRSETGESEALTRKAQKVAGPRDPAVRPG